MMAAITTRLRVLKTYARLDQKTAIKFVDYVLEMLPFKVEKVQTDQRLGVPRRVSLAFARPRYRARLHPTLVAVPQWQGGEVTPHRRRRVLSDARRRRDRRHPARQHQAQRMGALLQFRASSGLAQWPDPVRAAARTDP